ncbi:MULTISPECIES: phosphoglycerate kinase [Cysteiniphilum]|uniref:Phosphoglycerate kinase n=1 Tax=Cysteiniphilum litorale TaxID=2056700 RepID=A0A8J2Z612_9GAMM|nr:MULTISPECIES: phosphoglycerate kinase [Cysteiniphilum]GGG03371.1 phosphoglycerate kinase [Cysteiniphilum litorale]
MNFLSITDVPLKGKKVLMRVDFNVPVKDGKVTSFVRIDAALPTIKYALNQGASVILMSHLGRPEEGEYNEEYSLKPVAECLTQKLGQSVNLIKDYLSGVNVNAGDVVICENVRFNKGEKKSDDALSRKLASLCDVFVMDAFATAHRAQASTYGVAKYAPVACAGLLLTEELNALKAVLKNPQKPLAAIVGGSKVSTKLTVLENLIDQVDQLIVGGGIANTFLVAAGFNVGKSLIEADLVDTARALIDKARAKGADIPLPIDVRVAKSFSEEAKAEIKTIESIEPDDMILDIGPLTEVKLAATIAKAKTILWNGPVGVFEFPEFEAGTKAIAKAIADSDAFSVAGGGDTIAAIEKFNIKDKVSYISTAGGAFLEFIEGKTLPGVEVLCERAQEVKA